MKMDAIEELAVMIDFMERHGLLPAVIDVAVNGANEGSLGCHDETNVDTAVVSAGFQLLGETIAQHASPIAAIIILERLVWMRDATMNVIKAFPR